MTLEELARKHASRGVWQAEHIFTLDQLRALITEAVGIVQGDNSIWISSCIFDNAHKKEPTPEGDKYVAPGQQLLNTTISAKQHDYYGQLELHHNDITRLK